MRSLKNCLQQVTQAVGHTSSRYPQKKIAVLQLINQKHLQWGLLPISPWQENGEHFPLKVRWVQFSSQDIGMWRGLLIVSVLQINTFAEFCGASLWITPHPTQKRPTLAAWCWDWTGRSTDLTLWCTIHQGWRFDDVATRNLTMAYLVGHVLFKRQKHDAFELTSKG